MRNLQEQRHGLGRKVFHGRESEVYRAYHDGWKTSSARSDSS
jgi:hypothetical protein